MQDDGERFLHNIHGVRARLTRCEAAGNECDPLDRPSDTSMPDNGGEGQVCPSDMPTFGVCLVHPFPVYSTQRAVRGVHLYETESNSPETR